MRGRISYYVLELPVLVLAFGIVMVAALSIALRGSLNQVLTEFHWWVSMHDAQLLCIFVQNSSQNLCKSHPCLTVHAKKTLVTAAAATALMNIVINLFGSLWSMSPWLISLQLDILDEENEHEDSDIVSMAALIAATRAKCWWHPPMYCQCLDWKNHIKKIKCIIYIMFPFANCLPCCLLLSRLINFKEWGGPMGQDTSLKHSSCTAWFITWLAAHFMTFMWILEWWSLLF